MTQTNSDNHRWRIGRDTIYGTQGTPYMRRWFFWCPWFGVRIHHILRSDEDRHLHNHPWSFVSLLLTGGYTEVVQCEDCQHEQANSCAWERLPPCRLPEKRAWSHWSLVRHKATDYHRLIVDRPIWTLVLTGPKRNSWGFLTERGKVGWREYLARAGS